MKKLRLFFALAVMFLMPNLSFAQGRSYIREQITRRGECKNVAITKTGGDLMLYGNNGWAADGCPRGLTNALSELNDNNETINDVVLTEDGSWLVFYGRNGFRWNDIPYSLERELRDYNESNEKVLCASFNDDGDWVVITTEHFSASGDAILEWLKDGCDKYGMLWTVCLTDDCLVAVYEDGYKYFGDVPYDLKTKLNETSIDVFRLKIAGTAWFFADKNGNYSYSM